MTADATGGVFTYAAELTAHLAAAGVGVTLATLGPPLDRAQRRLLQGIPGLDVWEGPFRLEWMPDPWDDVARAGEWLLALAETVRPGVVHLNGYAHAALPWGAPTLVVAHSCVVSWWSAVRREPLPAGFHRYRCEVERGLAAARLVVAPSRAMLAVLRQHYGPLPRAVVVPNGRGPGGFRPGPKTALVFAAGRVWDEAKNLAALARVAGRLPWPVVLAGDLAPPGGSPVRLPGVRLLGRVPAGEVAGWLARAAVYALPARYEPFGLSVLEAALSGCALVLGDIPTLRELWDGAAVFVAPDDDEALVAAIGGLAGDAARRADLARRARARARALSAERMAAAYRVLYGGLRGEDAPAPGARALWPERAVA
jgi:glycosyltransferase involved in cell wall biosynthesis